jgi:hypothetical protein
METTSRPATPTSSPPVETATSATVATASDRLGEMLGRAASDEREKQRNEELAKRARIANAD